MSQEANEPKQTFDRKKKATITPIAGKGIIETIISRKDEEITPWETCTLPSKGLYYENMIPDGIVEVRPMGMAADKILATQRLAQSGKSLDYLFKQCVKLPENFGPYNLLAGDRVFLLYYLRGITHGSKYEFIGECTNEDCRMSNTFEYDLNNLDIKYAKKESGEEPWQVELPKMTELVGSPVWVKVRLLRGYDLLKLTKSIKQRRKTRPASRFVEEDMGKLDDAVIDETLAQNLVNLIVEVGAGDDISKDRAVIEKFVEKLHSSDHGIIREFINDMSPGVNTTITVTCESCGQEMKMDLPITESFFRPSKPVDRD